MHLYPAREYTTTNHLYIHQKLQYVHYQQNMKHYSTFQQGERLGLLPLHGVERRAGPGQGLHEGRRHHAGGARHGRGAARRLVGLQEAHRICRSVLTEC